MGHRLTRIYTKTGDDGTTGLGDGSRVSKNDWRIEALGAVDELNCTLGRILAAEIPHEARQCLERVQHDLFEVGAELSLPGQERIREDHVARLERELDAFNENLPPLKEFILPGGAPVAFGADLAWVAELRERHVALGRAAEEAALAVQREVVRAHYELDAARRMFEVAARSTEPLSAQSVEERIHLYEAGRGDFAELTAALQLHLRAAHDVAAARHEYGMAQAMLWMAAGARPEAVGDASEGGER